jgi:hypothetical protein
MMGVCGWVFDVFYEGRAGDGLSSIQWTFNGNWI